MPDHARPSLGTAHRIAMLLAVILTLMAAVLGLKGTYAAFSDSRVVGNNEVRAGVWETDPVAPAECADMTLDNVISGTPGADFLVGTDANDLILGLGGDDVILGGKGGDCLLGGEGHDLIGGFGMPEFHGFSALTTTKIGQQKTDLLGDLLEAGNDVLVGAAGNDGLFGGFGDDTLHGGEGDDLLINGFDSDELYGGPGSDVLKGFHAGVVNGGSSLTTPDLEIDTCLFGLMKKSQLGECEHMSLFGLLALDGGAQEAESQVEGILTEEDDAPTSEQETDGEPDVPVAKPPADETAGEASPQMDAVDGPVILSEEETDDPEETEEPDAPAAESEPAQAAEPLLDPYVQSTPLDSTTVEESQ